MDRRGGVMAEFTLIDGSVVDSNSVDYMLFCEALNLSKKPLHQRRAFLTKLKKKHVQRVEKLEYWLKLIWSKKNDPTGERQSTLI
jgi:hypothetical protein